MDIVLTVPSRIRPGVTVQADCAIEDARNDIERKHLHRYPEPRFRRAATPA